jgi:hypothetical protein
VPRGRREDKVEAVFGGRVPGLEGTFGDLDVREADQIAPGRCSQPRPEFDAGDPEAETSERLCGLPGGASDLQEPVACTEIGQLDQLVVQLPGILGSRLLVKVSHRVERCPQPLSVVACHADHHLVATGHEQSHRAHARAERLGAH